MTFDLSSVPDVFKSKAEELTKIYSFSGDCAKGANGYILFGKNMQLDRRVAIKFYFWGDGAHVEPSYLAKLEHQNILKIDHAEAIDKEYAYFVTRYCDGGDLDNWISGPPSSLRKVVDATQQVAGAVSYLHAQGFLHRDLKPSNIFAEGGASFVVGDFGSVVAVNQNDHAISLTKHSLIYRPPEDFDANQFFRQGDIYQLGILLYQLLGGYLPYESELWLTDTEIAKSSGLSGFDRQIFINSCVEKRIRSGRVIGYHSLPFFVPRKLRSIIRRATKQSYAERFATVSDFIAALNDYLQTSVEWQFEDEHWVAKGRRVDYRCFVLHDGTVCVEKRKTSGWRRDNSIVAGSLLTAAQQIEECID